MYNYVVIIGTFQSRSLEDILTNTLKLTVKYGPVRIFRVGPFYSQVFLCSSESIQTLLSTGGKIRYQIKMVLTKSLHCIYTVVTI